jgi:hypothetical protein
MRATVFGNTAVHLDGPRQSKGTIMAASTITCPECGNVMRPAKPVPAGKKVKCPECTHVFLPAAADRPETAVAKEPAKSAAKSAGKPEAKKSAGKAAPDKPAKNPDAEAPKNDSQAIPFMDDEDEGPATYSFVDDHSTADEPEIDHVPDTSIKDLRGPAQEAVMRPSNLMILLNVLGFLFYLAFLAIVLIPIAFPVPVSIDPEGSGAPAQVKVGPKTKKKLFETGEWVAGVVPDNLLKQDTGAKDEDTGSLFKFEEWDLIEVSTYDWWVITLIVIGVVISMILNAAVIYGGVKIQTLESRTLGIFASIITMIPAVGAGTYIILGLGVTLLTDFLFPDGWTLWFIIMLGIGIFGVYIGNGVFCLVTLMRQDVIDGYEYVPE